MNKADTKNTNSKIIDMQIIESTADPHAKTAETTLEAASDGPPEDGEVISKTPSELNEDLEGASEANKDSEGST